MQLQGPRAYAAVDVFTTKAGMGNALAVILEAEGLTDVQMQRIARWTNMSETVFVFEAAHSDADYRVRIFTPAGELPFAGHPTLGCAAAWLDAGFAPKGTSSLVQECGIGLVEVRLRDDDIVAFAAPGLVRSGSLDGKDLKALCQVAGVSKDDVVDHQWVDNGPGWAVLELASEKAVSDVVVDFAALGDRKFGVFAPTSGTAADRYVLRAFSSVGEDPVTGSLTAGLATWLRGRKGTPASYSTTQGTSIDRAGRVTVDVEGDTIWVGGKCLVLAKGTVEI